ncbi:MAG: hypothetical protein AAB263_06920, partial [Planctomycetota bacterium]
MSSTQRTVSTQIRILRPLASVLFAAALCVPLAAEEGGGKADPNFPNQDQAKAQFAEGVQQYRAGRIKEAAIAFRNALQNDPENKLVYEFYLACGDAMMVRMQDQDVLDDVLKDVLRRARIYQKQLRRDPAYINLLMSKLEKGEEERIVASNELAAIGPFAVPILLTSMADTPQEERRTYCRVVLTKMGGRSVLPLTTALASKDQRQLKSVALVLGDIADPRAIPALLRCQTRGDLDDLTKQILASTITAIATRSKITDLSQPDTIHLSEALRYFRGGPEIRDEQTAAANLTWRWDEEQQGAAKLQFVRVPGYAWKELVAEEILFQGMATWPKTPGFQPALAAVYAAQMVGVEQRARMAKERTAPSEQAEDAAEAIAERVQALAEAGNRVRMAGAANICRAVQQSLASQRYDVAVGLMRVLEDRDLARPELILPDKAISADKPGSVLISALDNPEKMVRYQAAITLASIDAPAFAASEKVVPVLADAVGEWGVRVVLVIDQDYRQRNAARAALQAKGYIVITAADGFEAMNRLTEAPIKDAVIVAGDLSPTLKNEHGGMLDAPQQTAADQEISKGKTRPGLVTVLAADPRLAGAPIFVSLPDAPDRAAKVQAQFEGKLAGRGGFVAKPFDAVELHDKIEAGLKDTKAPTLNQAAAEEISLRAAIALQRPDPLRTVLNLGLATQSLLATIDARADALRIETLKAIGRSALSTAGAAALKPLASRITDVYGSQDAELEKNPQLRAAFVYAIGKVDPTSDASIAILKKTLAHTDAGVRAAAANAVGALITVPPELLAAYQQQQRLDARAAGA